MQMTTVVEADRVLIGPEFIPRASAGLGITTPNNKIVMAGETYVPGPADVWDYLEIQSGGSLVASRTQDTVLSFITAIVLPGGVWDKGTTASPMTPGHFETVFRDVPIDLAVDPFQWSHGLINFGSRYQVAPAKDPWVEAVGAIAKGATTITLAAVPNNWEIGDAILIPDTANPQLLQPKGTELPPPRRETPVTITAIDGATIRLSKPLDFEHLIIRTPRIDPNTLTAEMTAFLTARGISLTGSDQVVVPSVFNLTRAHLCTRSENKGGTRGHQVDVGAGAFWDIEYNCTEGLGRTTTAPIDKTIFPSPFTGAPTHIGTNEIARYNDHRHHCDSSPSCKTIGNVWSGDGDSSDAAKWGISIHSTSDSLIQHNIAIDFNGAGIVTEDGNEVRNTFDHNATLYCGSLDPVERHRLQNSDASLNIANLQPGTEGTGFWFHGVQNTFTRNIAFNCFSSGLNLMNQDQPAGILYPSVVGGMPDTPLLETPPGMLPVLFADNVSCCHSLFGVENWSVRLFPMTRLIAAFSTFDQIHPFAGNGTSLDLDDCTLLGNADGPVVPWWPQSCVSSSSGYVQKFKANGGQFRGGIISIMGGGSLEGLLVTGTILQGVTNIDLLPFDTTIFDSGLHLQLIGHPAQYIVTNPTDPPVWSGAGPLPVGASNIIWWNNHGTPFSIKNWQATGQDGLLFWDAQLGTNPAWPSTNYGVEYACPDVGRTMQECWDTYGNALGGDVLDPAVAVTLDGIIGASVRWGLTPTPAQPPRAIVTQPTLRDPVSTTSNDPISRGLLTIYALATGDPMLASPVLMYSVDGDPPIAVGGSGDPTMPDKRTFTTAHIAEGVHTVSVWRTTLADPTVELPGSRMTAQYVVGIGVAPPPPPPPPPPPLVTVPTLVGLTEPAAAAALTAAGLTLGEVTMISTVIEQSPAAGSAVPPGSAITLVVT